MTFADAISLRKHASSVLPREDQRLHFFMAFMAFGGAAAFAAFMAFIAPLYRLPTDEYVYVRMKKFVCNATEPQAAADGLRENQNLRHRAYSVAKGQGSKLPWAVGL